jgi:hypothetical protein
MTSRRFRLCALVAACALAGCVAQAPFEPAPIRFGGVDFLETDAVPAPGVLISLNRDAGSPCDAFLATVIIDKPLLDSKPTAHLTVTSGGNEVARLDIPDVRNSRLDVHVHLRNAPPGRYTLRVEVGSLAVEKPFAVQ